MMMLARDSRIIAIGGITAFLLVAILAVPSFGEERYTFLAAWDKGSTAKDGEMRSPVSVAVDQQGQVYVADLRNHRIQKFDASGKFLATWGGLDELKDPRGVAVDRKGQIYVADAGTNQIKKFSPNGKLLTQWGRTGSGPGEFRSQARLPKTLPAPLHSHLVVPFAWHKVARCKGLWFVPFLRHPPPASCKNPAVLLLSVENSLLYQ